MKAKTLVIDIVDNNAIKILEALHQMKAISIRHEYFSEFEFQLFKEAPFKGLHIEFEFYGLRPIKNSLTGPFKDPDAYIMTLKEPIVEIEGIPFEIDNVEHRRFIWESSEVLISKEDFNSVISDFEFEEGDKTRGKYCGDKLFWDVGLKERLWLVSSALEQHLLSINHKTTIQQERLKSLFNNLQSKIDNQSGHSSKQT